MRDETEILERAEASAVADGLSEKQHPKRRCLCLRGRPDTLKPSHELYGEILPRAGRPAEAARQFATALARQPNRARSLFGTARARARAGDRADAHLHELKEARYCLAHEAER
ncbi:MAG TPA: hypothetical protein VER32_05560 [Pyrinomonadaceae bacterium]|nr:hypothetical protein [Pyrinomonadaceae bacterium]